MCQRPFERHGGPRESGLSLSRDRLILAECRHPKCCTGWGRSSVCSPWHQVLNVVFPVPRQHLETLLLPVTHWDGQTDDRFPFSECLTKVSEPSPFSSVLERFLLFQESASRGFYTSLWRWKDMTFLKMETNRGVGEAGGRLCPRTPMPPRGQGPFCSFRGCNTCVPPPYLARGCGSTRHPSTPESWCRFLWRKQKGLPVPSHHQYPYE